MLALQLGRDRADHPAERADQRRGAAFGDGDRQAALAADGGDLRAGEPGADDQHPARVRRVEPPVQRGARRRGCAATNTPSRPPPPRVRPRPGPHAGGDQQPVESRPRRRRPAAPAWPPGPARWRRRRAASRASTSRRRGSAVRSAARPAQQHLLGQRRPVVRLVGLVADQGQRPGEALVAQRLRGPQPGQRGADDDDRGPRAEACPARPSPATGRPLAAASGSPGRVVRPRRGWPGPGRPPRPAAPARAASSSASGSYSSASSPCMVKTSGARNAHCAYPWQRFRSTTSLIGALPFARLGSPGHPLLGPAWARRRGPRAQPGRWGDGGESGNAARFAARRRVRGRSVPVGAGA